MEGHFPEMEDEIAVDRMHADNTGIKIGDTVTVGSQSYQVAGLIAYVNYSTLHEKSTDFMFDALKFDVAMVTAEGFEHLSSEVHYAYAWQFEKKPDDETEDFKVLCILLSAVLIYLLTKLIIEKNENAISMTKILGYENREIASLFYFPQRWS